MTTAWSFILKGRAAVTSGAAGGAAEFLRSEEKHEEEEAETRGVSVHVGSEKRDFIVRQFNEY